MTSSALAWGLLLGLSLLNLVLLITLGAVLLRMRRRMRLARKADKVARRQTGKREAVERLHRQRMTWRQVEDLFWHYRMLDRKPELPRMRFGPASPDFLLHVIERIRSDRPKNIVECGSGTSTIVLAHLLKVLGIDSHIYTLENYQRSIHHVRRQLRQHDLEQFVTIIAVPLVKKRYDGFGTDFQWYDLDPAAIPATIDLLIVDGPHGSVNRYARYPAGPELLPRLSRDARVFVDDANRPDERAIVRRWQESNPGLGVRSIAAEKGCVELFLLDREVEKQQVEQRAKAD
jgi:hypothetical protein